MSTLGFLNFETGDLSEAVAYTSGGVVAASTSHPASGTYSLECNPSGSGLASYQIGVFGTPTSSAGLSALGFSTGGTVYFRFYVYVGTLPAVANDEEILSFTDSSNTLLCSLRVTTTGALNINNASGNVSGTVIAVIPAGSSYLVQLSFPLGASGAWNCLVNGVSKMSGTASFGTTAAANVYLGKRINSNSNGYNLYFDDVAWSTTAFPSASTGGIMVPVGSGNNSSWTGSYTSVSGVPGSGNAGITDATGGDYSSFRVTSPATLGIPTNATITGVKILALAKSSVSAQVNTNLIAGATNHLSTATTLTSSFLAYGQYYAINPTSSAAWTFADLQSLQVGIVNVASSAATAEGLYALVDWSAGTPATFTVSGTSQLNVSASGDGIRGEIHTVSAATGLNLSVLATGHDYTSVTVAGISVSASDTVQLQGTAPFVSWPQMQYYQPGTYGYINPIRVSATGHANFSVATSTFAVGPKPVSATGHVNLSVTASLLATRIWLVSATTGVSISAGGASATRNSSYLVSAVTSVALRVTPGNTATRNYSVSASGNFNLSVAPTITAFNTNYIVGATTGLNLSGTSVLARSHTVVAATGLNLSGTIGLLKSVGVVATTQVHFTVLAAANRTAYASATGHVNLSVSTASSHNYSVAATTHVNLSGVAGVTLSHLTALTSVAMVGVASAEVVTQAGTTINGGDFVQGPPTSLISGLDASQPFTFAETPTGMLILANGLDPMIRWTGQAGADYAGVKPPTTAIALAGSNVGTITGTRYAFCRFLDQNYNPSNLSPISNAVNFGRDAVIDGVAYNATSGVVTITSVAHGLTVGEFIVIGGIEGLTQLNNAPGAYWTTASVPTPDTFTLTAPLIYSGTYLQGGYWIWGCANVVYQNVPLPTETKVARRQILRTLNGVFDTLYVDIDTADLSTTTWTSNLTDDQLAANESLPISINGDMPYANRYSVPPSHKGVVVANQGRLFAAVDVSYSTGSVVPRSGSASVPVVGASVKAGWVGRFLYVPTCPTPCEIASVDPVGGVLTLARPYPGATAPYASYTIKPAPGERNLVYYSEPGMPEAWPEWNAFAVMEDGDEIRGLLVKDTYLYILKKRHIYRFTFQKSPADDGFSFLSATRGVLNHRCQVQVEDVVYMLDEAGIHAFDGQGTKHISTPIQPIFQQDNLSPTLKVDWTADRALWHAVHEPLRDTVRFFVQMANTQGIYHAICFNYRNERWWIEQYPNQVTSSANGDLPARRALVGGDSRRVLLLSEGQLDGAPVGGTLSGTIESAGSYTITDNQAGFSGNLLGVPVTMTSGVARGQSSIISSWSSNTITLVQPFNPTPNAGDTYQIGGINWQWQSGCYDLNSEQYETPRDVELTFRPTTNPAALDVQLFYNHAGVASPFPLPVNQDTFTAIAGDTHATASLQIRGAKDGYAILRGSIHQDTYAFGDGCLAINLSGTQSNETVQVYYVGLTGANPNGRP